VRRAEPGVPTPSVVRRRRVFARREFAVRRDEPRADVLPRAGEAGGAADVPRGVGGRRPGPEPVRGRAVLPAQRAGRAVPVAARLGAGEEERRARRARRGVHLARVPARHARRDRRRDRREHRRAFAARSRPAARRRAVRHRRAASSARGWRDGPRTPGPRAVAGPRGERRRRRRRRGGGGAHGDGRRRQPRGDVGSRRHRRRRRLAVGSLVRRSHCGHDLAHEKRAPRRRRPP